MKYNNEEKDLSKYGTYHDDDNLIKISRKSFRKLVINYII